MWQSSIRGQIFFYDVWFWMFFSRGFGLKNVLKFARLLKLCAKVKPSLNSNKDLQASNLIFKSPLSAYFCQKSVTCLSFKLTKYFGLPKIFGQFKTILYSETFFSLQKFFSQKFKPFDFFFFFFFFLRIL